MRKFLVAALAVTTLLVGTTVAFAADTVTGEIVEKACFVDRGAHGEDHAACAKRCFERGGDVGLLTADGDLYILKPAEDAEAFEALKGLAGQTVSVTGDWGENDGEYKTFIVTASATN